MPGPRPLVILGAGGFVGSAVSRAAQRQNLPASLFTHAQADITDPAAVMRAVKGAEIVINCAAFAGVDAMETQPLEALAVNRDGARRVAEVAHKFGAALIHLSTDFVFDGEKAEPYVETDPVGPLSVYARAKADAEQEVMHACPRSLVVRVSWVYAATGRGFVADLLKWSRERDEVSVVTDQRGSPTSVDELADGLITMATAARTLPRSFAWGIYHLAGEGSATRFELAQQVLAIAAEFGQQTPRLKPTTLAGFPSAAKRPLNSALDSSKARASFGIKMSPWHEALRRALTGHFSTQSNRA